MRETVPQKERVLGLITLFLVIKFGFTLDSTFVQLKCFLLEGWSINDVMLFGDIFGLSFPLVIFVMHPLQLLVMQTHPSLLQHDLIHNTIHNTI